MSEEREEVTLTIPEDATIHWKTTIDGDVYSLWGEKVSQTRVWSGRILNRLRGDGKLPRVAAPSTWPPEYVLEWMLSPPEEFERVQELATETIHGAIKTEALAQMLKEADEPTTAGDGRVLLEMTWKDWTHIHSAWTKG